MFELFSDWLIYDLFDLDAEAKYTAALHFFVYDSIKILSLIAFVIFLISFVQTFLPLGKIKKSLQNQRFGLGYFTAAILGSVSPFCSCPSIPLL